MSDRKVDLLVGPPRVWPTGVSVPVRRSLPFYSSRVGRRAAPYVHRVRAAHIGYVRGSGTVGHMSVDLWCGAMGSIPRHGTLLAEPPEGRVVCATCEGRAVGAGQVPAASLADRTLMFSPVREHRARVRAEAAPTPRPMPPVSRSGPQHIFGDGFVDDPAPPPGTILPAVLVRRVAAPDYPSAAAWFRARGNDRLAADIDAGHRIGTLHVVRSAADVTAAVASGCGPGGHGPDGDGGWALGWAEGPWHPPTADALRAVLAVYPPTRWVP